MTEKNRQVIRFIGVYHANGSLLGEVRYLFTKLVGSGSCSLCDITHSGLSKNKTWSNCEKQLPVPIEFFHLDELTPELEALTRNQTPCVVAEDSTQLKIAVSAEQLNHLIGQPEALFQKLMELLGKSREQSE
ncbi:MAG: hypothetical protein VYC39_06180 [Myxococcota bacterium]|nr:hypothetical protein [Myxococcota bacterium]